MSRQTRKLIVSVMLEFRKHFKTHLPQIEFAYVTLRSRVTLNLFVGAHFEISVTSTRQWRMDLRDFTPIRRGL